MEEIKLCPYCGKEIKSKAKKCRFCNTWLTEQRPKTTAVPISHKESDGSLAERLEAMIANYIASHDKKYDALFLAGYNMNDEVIALHRNYAPVQEGEKVLLITSKTLKLSAKINTYGSFVISDKFLYYKLVSPKFGAFPVLKMFTHRSKGVVALSSIKSLEIKDDSATLDGKYFGHEVWLNDALLGLVTIPTMMNREEIAEVLNRIFKVFRQ